MKTNTGLRCCIGWIHQNEYMQRVMAPMQRVMASMQRVMAALPQVNQWAKQQLLVKQRPKLLQGASVDPEQQTDPFDMGPHG